MLSKKPMRPVMLFALLATLTLLPACAQTSSAINPVVETVKFVCLSRKDTLPTIRQVGENNAALLALGAQKPKCK